MARIFISYSRADKQFAQELVRLLRKFGYTDVWIDSTIPGGTRWWDVILTEIARSDLFLFLLTNDSLASPYCQAEYREALRLRKKILPVQARSKTDIAAYAPPDLKKELESTQYVDVPPGFGDPDALTDLYSSINYLMQQIPAKPLPPLSPEPTSLPKPAVEPETPEPTSSTWETRPVSGTTATYAPVAPPPKSDSSLWLKIIAGLLAILIVGVIVIGSGILRPPDVTPATNQTAPQEVGEQSIDITQTETVIDTPFPTVTDTLAPTVTDKPSPTATDTPSPTITDTPSPTATDTPSPTVTDTPSPTTTDIPIPLPAYTIYLDSGDTQLEMWSIPSDEGTPLTNFYNTRLPILGKTADGS